MFYYKKYCKICGVLTDSWKISKNYFEFLKRSPGVSYPEDKPNECTYQWVCESCAPDYYSDPKWVAPEPFKKRPLPVPSIQTPAGVPRPPTSPAPQVSTPVPHVAPTRRPPPPRMPVPMPRQSAPQAATASEPAKVYKSPAVEKAVEKLPINKFKVPPLKK